MRAFDRGTRTSGGISLTGLFDECHPTDSLAPYQAQIREWATTYLVAPHPELGREGAVCPFTGASISKEIFLVGCVDSPDLTVADIKQTMAGLMAEFNLLPPADGSDALFKAILILFPAVTDYRMIDEAQKHLKAESVPLGLMVGQFYPGCEEPGIRNREFRPLRSPLPLLAIRHMVSSDFPFLAKNPAWTQEYFRRFSPATPSSVRNLIAARSDTENVEIVG